MVFVKAKVSPPNIGDKDDLFTVQYFDEQGNMTIRSYGTRAWRCNNPGNLHATHYSTNKQRRCIGRAGDDKDEYAVYPDYETGHEALIVMLRGSKYFHLTLREASILYVKPDPNHIHKIVKLSKLNADRTIQSLNEKEFEAYWKAIEENEGWIKGKEDPIDRKFITGVHKKNGIIYEYRIQKNGEDIWLLKSNAVAMAKSHQLHAIVIHMKNGSCYLRSEYHTQPFSSLIV